MGRSPSRNLVPVRLGFNLMVHRDVPAILQLLELIYRPEHFYVFHVDRRAAGVRADLEAELAYRYVTPNIRVLPANRSFVASWGSFFIARAQVRLHATFLRTLFRLFVDGGVRGALSDGRLGLCHQHERVRPHPQERGGHRFRPGPVQG